MTNPNLNLNGLNSDKQSKTAESEVHIFNIYYDVFILQRCFWCKTLLDICIDKCYNLIQIYDSLKTAHFSLIKLRFHLFLTCSSDYWYLWKSCFFYLFCIKIEILLKYLSFSKHMNVDFSFLFDELLKNFRIFFSK